MNSLALGDDLAAGLGENVFRTRLLAAAGAVILCGAATAVAGPIAFVGPRRSRTSAGCWSGPDHRWLLPFCAVAGAGLLVAADVIGRVVARPDEIEVGIITALHRRPGLHLDRPAPEGARAVSVAARSSPAPRRCAAAVAARVLAVLGILIAAACSR